MSDHVLMPRVRRNFAECQCGQTASVVGEDGAQLWHVTHKLWPDLSPAEVATKVMRLVTERPV